MTDIIVYKCPACGGRMEFDSKTQHMKCPFCDTELSVEEYEAQQPEADLSQNPNEENGNHIDEIRGIYVPFWLFDANVEASVQYAMTETDSWESGGYIYTKSTEHAIYREGEVAFAGIPCDCSKKMDDTLMEAIEPYHFRDAVPFRAAYLAGYVADRYDVDMQDCIARATKRAQASTEKEMKYGLQSKGTITVKSNRIQVKSATYHYALYPVWILNTTWRGKQYTFAMNGQTGRMVGDLPFSRKEFWKYVIPRGMIAGAGIYAVLECFMVLSVYQWTAFHLSLMILAVLALVGLIRLLSK